MLSRYGIIVIRYKLSLLRGNNRDFGTYINNEEGD